MCENLTISVKIFFYSQLYFHFCRSVDSQRSESVQIDMESDQKYSKIYIDLPPRKARCNKTTENQALISSPYNPAHSRVELAKSELSEVNLLSRFGEKYSEPLCTPRIMILDLTEHVGLADKQKKFHLVLAHLAEGTDTDIYRYECQ